MICFHKFGKIDKGYQYCDKCGKAKTAPKCRHKWKKTSEYSGGYLFGGIAKGEFRECEYCGEIKNFKLF